MVLSKINEIRYQKRKLLIVFVLYLNQYVFNMAALLP